MIDLHIQLHDVEDVIEAIKMLRSIGEAMILEKN
jgi:hypothetical protein